MNIEAIHRIMQMTNQGITESTVASPTLALLLLVDDKNSFIKMCGVEGEEELSIIERSINLLLDTLIQLQASVQTVQTPTGTAQ